MFVDPHVVRSDRAGYCLRGCPRCAMKPVTLVMITPRGDRSETELFCCCRLPETYLADLYALYSGGGAGVGQTAPEHVRSVTSLVVDEIVDPKLWLDCVLWSRYRREGGAASLEVFVRRPRNSRSFYAVGIKGNVLTSPEESIRIHESTVGILCGKSKRDCPDPVIHCINQGG